MITYRATLDVPIDTLRQVSRWLTAHRKGRDARPWQRAATPYVQAVMVLRWFKEDTDVAILTRDAGVSVATGYRYLHEAIDVIADQAPELPDVLAKGLRQGFRLRLPGRHAHPQHPLQRPLPRRAAPRASPPDVPEPERRDNASTRARSRRSGSSCRARRGTRS